MLLMNIRGERISTFNMRVERIDTPAEKRGKEFDFRSKEGKR